MTCKKLPRHFSFTSFDMVATINQEFQIPFKKMRRFFDLQNIIILKHTAYAKKGG